MSTVQNSEPKSLIKNLWQRRFPQIIFIYLGCCWTILEFISWIIDHYALSPNLADFGFITLISMLPTVALLAFFHGKPGRDKWTRTEKIGIPMNVIFTAVLLVMIFSGKELGSATTEIMIRNGTGQTVNRQLPKSQFRKRLAIFYFDNTEQNPALDWLQSGIMAGCHLDLDQDPYFSTYSAYDEIIYHKIVQAGFADKKDIPMILEKKIAGEIQREYFLGGDYFRRQDTLYINTYLYETRKGKLISEHTIRGTDIFTLIDAICVKLKHDLELPGWAIETTPDLPISEIITQHVSAYREYILGTNRINQSNDYTGSIAHFKRATEIDPAFALAYWALYHSLINTNQPEKAVEALQQCMQYLYKLPENLQFDVKKEYYLITENPDKRRATVRMWTKLYPSDLRGHFQLAWEYIRKGDYDEAIEEFRTIYQIDPSRHYYLRYIGDTYIRKGDFKTALEYYRLYKEKYPKAPDAFIALGELFYIMGDYEQAKRYYTDAQILELTDVSALTRLGFIAMEEGSFDQALARFHSAMATAKTPLEKEFIHQGFQTYYARRGQIEKALENFRKRFRYQAHYINPIDVILNQVKDYSFHLYAEIGKSGEGFLRLSEFSQQLSQPWLKMLSLGYLDLYSATKNYENARETITEAEEALHAFGEEALSYHLDYARGKILEAEEDYVGAALQYQQVAQAQPLDPTIMTDIGRCYRKMGDPAKARKFIETTLSILPYYPDAHLEMARVTMALQDFAAARHHISQALMIWAPADKGFMPRLEAEKIASRLDLPT